METIVRQLAKDMEEQKKILKDIRKKQEDNITGKIETLEGKVGAMEVKVSSVDLKLTEQGKCLDFVHNEFKSLKDSQKVAERNQAELTRTVGEQQYAISKLKEHANNLERKSRERNMRLVGFKETEGENPSEIVKSVLIEKFGIAEPGVETAHRTGRKTTAAGRPRIRHLIFRLSRVETKYEILNPKREVLDGEDFYITEDMTQADMERKKKLAPVIEDAKQRRIPWKFRNGQLYLNGQFYRPP